MSSADETERSAGERVLVTGGSGFIGSAVLQRFADAGHEVVDFDLGPPQVESERIRWVPGDVLDAAAVAAAVRAHRPVAVVHLAARTDTDSDVLADYDVSVQGTRNVVRAVLDEAPGARLVHTSTQFVVRPGREVTGDATYDPHTTYGESKALSEDVVRSAATSLHWAIARPTNIWGPRHPRYPVEFWRVLRRGLYLHPAGRSVRRSYGYVGNVAEQFLQLATLPADVVEGRTFYLGDEPLLLEHWVDEFAQQLTGRRARRVPFGLLVAIARVGDVAAQRGLRAPLTSSRLRSMTEDYVVPMEPTLSTLSAGRPISLTEGVQQTVAWLRAEHR